jgi:hypothetical protein
LVDARSHGESLGSQLSFVVDHYSKQFLPTIISVKFVSVIMVPPTKRKYEASFKLKVIKMTKVSYCAAATEKMVRE